MLFCWIIDWGPPDAINSRLSAEWRADGHLVLFCLSVARQAQPPITIPLYVHISTLSRVTAVLLTDSGLPMNGSMLVGGVSQLAWTPQLLCASPNDFGSHSLSILLFFVVLPFRKKSHSCIFYLTGLTNMVRSRQVIDLVHPSHIGLPWEFSILPFVVSHHPSLFSVSF